MLRTGAPHVQNIYHFNNTQNQVWGNDREMMTSDAGGGVYSGNVKAQAAGSTTVTLAIQAHGTQPGGAMCVLGGTGAGECRRVLSSSSQPTPPLAPPAVPKQMTSLLLVPCAQAYAFKEENGEFGQTLAVAAAPGLAVTVVCTGSDNANSEGSGVGSCGAQPHPETVNLNKPDSWAKGVGNQDFIYNGANHSISLRKSGKCLGVAAHATGAKVSLQSCLDGERASKPKHADGRIDEDLREFDASFECKWQRSASGTFELLGKMDSAETLGGVGMCLGLSEGKGPSAPQVFTFNKPFTLPLDATSFITILPFTGQIAFNGNYYMDGGANDAAVFSRCCSCCCL